MGNIKFPNVVIPWDNEIENILNRLVRDRVTYSKNTRIASDFSRRYPELLDVGMLDIVTTNYRKKEKKTIFVLSPGTIIVPKNRKFQFHKIF